jgi:hypothetical protein
MLSKISKTLAVAAVCAATALSGCGDDEPKASTPATQADTSTPVPTSPAEAPDATPTQKWARATCDKLAGQMDALQPPQVSGTTPEDSQKSLVNFFNSLLEQLDKQASALRAAGSPPGPNAQREYEKALSELDRVERRIQSVTKRAEAANATSKAELDRLVNDLGKSLKVMSDYEGPIAQLLETRSLGKALGAEPACAALSPTGQTTS